MGIHSKISTLLIYLSVVSKCYIKFHSPPLQIPKHQNTQIPAFPLTYLDNGNLPNKSWFLRHRRHGRCPPYNKTPAASPTTHHQPHLHIMRARASERGESESARGVHLIRAVIPASQTSGAGREINISLSPRGWSMFGVTILGVRNIDSSERKRKLDVGETDIQQW